MLLYLLLIKDLLSNLINNCTNKFTCTNWNELNSHSSALVFQAISNYLLGSVKFDMTNKAIFVRFIYLCEGFLLISALIIYRHLKPL